MRKFDDTVKELVALAEAEGTEDDNVLDSLVGEVVSKMESDTNNAGLESQIKFILVHLGLNEETVNAIKVELEQ